jgi:hypothetical protein
MRGRGEPLPPDVRTRMEAAFNTDLSQVRVHADPQAAALSNTMAAVAFTRGSDIFFAVGEYAPDTPRGERTLAHELAHIQQQAGVPSVHRLWNLKATSVPWHKGHSTRTLKSRNVWFIKDDANDEIVVKIENQPIGLGDIVGSAAEEDHEHQVGRATQVGPIRSRSAASADRGVDGRARAELGRARP